MQKKVIEFSDLNFLEMIAQTLSGLMEMILGVIEDTYVSFMGLGWLGPLSEISADFDLYILVIFFEKSWFFI